MKVGVPKESKVFLEKSCRNNVYALLAGKQDKRNQSPNNVHIKAMDRGPDTISEGTLSESREEVVVDEMTMSADEEEAQNMLNDLALKK